ncbi:hypothetical protein [Streptomyces sp. H39-S7]|uniref:hypothetical protein n=1 Tax=Streptomyces sp. H39-S7 TaxID=3004357 RepID=UPI0022B06AA3|nr:hypothetical protein [Streptomyces sp. H39-S7]MCZ4119816.1 hypothetical protein [Streptomyces sp. H39-S7]
MSARDGRDAPPAPLALYDHALRQLREAPGGIPRRGGFPLPSSPEPIEFPALTWDGSRAAIQDALTPLPGGPEELRRRFTEFGVHGHHRYMIRSAVAELTVPAGQEAPARALGRRLTRAGTTWLTVATGMALLTRFGEPEDVPHLRVLGLLRDFLSPAVDALDILDRPDAALTWLAGYTRREALRPLVNALWARDAAAVHQELVAVPTSRNCMDGTVARRIAEAARLPALLDDHPGDAQLVAQAGALLAHMARSRSHQIELLAYRDALTVCEAVATRAGQLAPCVEHYVLLLSLVLELKSGPAALLEWAPGRRGDLLESLGRLLSTAPWAAVPDAASRHGNTDQQRRAAWIRRTSRQPFAGPATSSRLRVEVVTGDPAHLPPHETRILLDGRPLVPSAFGRGHANAPVYLLDGGRLRAGPEPREVQLAEASCTEGCCGALYVTIRRAGDHVLWQGWRRPPTAGHSEEPLPELPEYRFGAAAYDAEIARAETGRLRPWSACTTARLIGGPA